MLPLNLLALSYVLVTPLQPPTPLAAHTKPRCNIPIAYGEPLDAPRDELKSRFARSDDDGPKTAFAPDVKPADRNEQQQQSAASSSATAVADGAEPTANQRLLAEIRSLQKEKPAPPPEKAKIDLNGIQPRFLLLGAGSYGVFSVLAWQFTSGAAEYFANNPFESSFYFVQRLSSVARVVVVALGSLGTGITGIAALGQLALAKEVQDGIAAGELDPNAQRVDPYGGKKKGELEKMLGFMLGDKDAGLGK